MLGRPARAFSACRAADGVGPLTVALALLFTSACSDEDAAGDEVVTFEALRAESVGPDRATIRFTTSLPTTCEVEYGMSIGTLDLRAEDPSMVDDELSIDHEVPLEDLTPGTNYYYRARAEDARGRIFFSDTQSFTTLAADDSLGANVALLSAGASVTGVSSNFGGADDDERWGAEAAFDGAMGTEWSSAGDGDDAWVELDLGTPRALRTVRYRSRAMGDGSAIVTGFQLVIDDGAATLGPFTCEDPDVACVFALEEAVAALRVRFEVVSSTGGNTGARELQLYE